MKNAPPTPITAGGEVGDTDRRPLPLPPRPPATSMERLARSEGAPEGEDGGENRASPCGPCVIHAWIASRSMGRRSLCPVSWLTSSKEAGARTQRRWCQRRKMNPSEWAKKVPKLFV